MILIIMGVAGSGKSRIGKLLSADLAWPFYEGDDFHPPENVAKLSQGIPLDDEDRLPWLHALRQSIVSTLERGKNAILACSALKKSYRDLLRDGKDEVRFIYLKGDFDLLSQRLQNRREHFMKADMLASQFETLEEPEQALVVDVRLKPEEIVKIVRKELNL